MTFEWYLIVLLCYYPHLMYIKLAVVTPISPSTANLSYIPKAVSLPFSYLVVVIHNHFYFHIFHESFDPRNTHTLDFTPKYNRGMFVYVEHSTYLSKYLSERSLKTMGYPSIPPSFKHSSTARNVFEIFQTRVSHHFDQFSWSPHVQLKYLPHIRVQHDSRPPASIRILLDMYLKAIRQEVRLWKWRCTWSEFIFVGVKFW